MQLQPSSLGLLALCFFTLTATGVFISNSSQPACLLRRHRYVIVSWSHGPDGTTGDWRGGRWKNRIGRQTAASWRGIHIAALLRGNDSTLHDLCRLHGIAEADPAGLIALL
jgi:hypothetical protein